jgi:hypothetical protein
MKGPWEYRENNPPGSGGLRSAIDPPYEDWPFLIVMPAAPFAFGKTGAAVSRSQDSPIEEAEEIARLIAAAPDLLEALKLLTEEGDPRGQKLARIAIAKAEGRKL